MKKFYFLFLMVLAIPNASQAYNCAVSSHATVTVTGTSLVVLAANQNRKCLIVQNQGATSIQMKLGSAQSLAEGTSFVPGAIWEPDNVPTSSLFMKTSTGSGTDVVDIMEGVTTP